MKNPVVKSKSMASLIDQLMVAGKHGLLKYNSGESWQNVELAQFMQVTPETVSKWRNGYPVADRFRAKLIKAFFRADEHDSADYIALDRALAKEYGKGEIGLLHGGGPSEGPTEYHLTSTAFLFWQALIRKLSSSHPNIQDQLLGYDLFGKTPRNAARLLSNLTGADYTTTRKAADVARQTAYEQKYKQPLGFKDERVALTGDSRLWGEEVKALLLNAGCRLNEPCVCVGIGNRGEGDLLYPQFANFVAFDISQAVVDYVRNERKLDVRQSPAEELALVSGTAATYLSFRTFNSSFFDIERAAHEACRVLRPAGLALVSIPRVYLVQDQQKPIFGLSRTIYGLRSIQKFGGYGPVDQEYATELAAEIANTFASTGFENIRMHTGAAEYYILATKIDTRGRPERSVP